MKKQSALVNNGWKGTKMKKRASDSTGLGVLMVDVKQAAAMCNIGVSTVWKLVKNGKFPKPIAFTPKCVRWKRSDIVEWVKTLSTNDTSAA